MGNQWEPMQTPGAPLAPGATCAPEAQACQAHLVRQMRRGIHMRQVCHVLHPRQVRHERGVRRAGQARHSTGQHTSDNTSTPIKNQRKMAAGFAIMVYGMRTRNHVALFFPHGLWARARTR